MQGPNQGFIKKDVTLSITGSLIPYIQNDQLVYVGKQGTVFISVVSRMHCFLRCGNEVGVMNCQVCWTLLKRSQSAEHELQTSKTNSHEPFNWPDRVSYQPVFLQSFTGLSGPYSITVKWIGFVYHVGQEERISREAVWGKCREVSQLTLHCPWDYQVFISISASQVFIILEQFRYSLQGHN